MLEGERQSPVRDVGFSAVICDTISGQAAGGVSPGTSLCSPSLRYLQNKKLIPNSVLAELALRKTWL